MPLKIDENYVYGYKLEDEFDNGGYFQAHFNETSHIVEKMKNSDANKKTATIFLIIGGMFMKILPCIIIFFICRNRGRQGVGLQDALGRAAAGYRRLGRNLSSRR